MKLLKFLKVIWNLPIIIKYGLYLEHRHFEKLEKICKKRLTKKENDFLGLFFLMKVYTYQEIFELSKNYFIKMLKIENIGYKLQKYFIYNVIGKLLKTKNYAIVIKYCNELLIFEKNKKAIKLIKRALCEAYYNSHDFLKVLDYCKELKEEYPDDKEIIDFTNGYYKAMKKVMDKKKAQ